MKNENNKHINEENKTVQPPSDETAPLIVGGNTDGSTIMSERIDNPTNNDNTINGVGGNNTKRKRGRPRKTLDKENTETAKEKDLDENIIEKELGRFNDVTKPETNTHQKSESNITSLITGYMFLTACDFIFPSFSLWVLKKISKDYSHIKPKNIRLDEKEKSDLEPLADAAVKDLMLDISPMTALMIVLMFTYGGKITALKNE